MISWPATYTDARGVETTVVLNDGETLRLPLRGVEFAGRDFDSLAAPANAPPEALRRFSFSGGCLCSCRIECEIPVSIHDSGQDAGGVLRVELSLGDARPDGGIDREELRLVLTVGDRRYAGSGTGGWFEDELLEIQAQLPEGVYIRTCINCMFSDYSPYGHGVFGWMMCFRNLKDEYLQVVSKETFWPLHDRYERLVQETWLCPEFERRAPGTGYRG